MKTLIKWGYDFEKAEMVFVIRKIDVEKGDIAKKVLKLMQESKAKDPAEFFKEKKICFLATKENYVSFLLSLQKLEKNSL